MVTRPHETKHSSACCVQLPWWRRCVPPKPPKSSASGPPESLTPMFHMENFLDLDLIRSFLHSLCIKSWHTNVPRQKFKDGQSIHQSNRTKFSPTNFHVDLTSIPSILPLCTSFKSFRLCAAQDAAAVKAKRGGLRDCGVSQLQRDWPKVSWTRSILVHKHTYICIHTCVYIYIHIAHV